MKPICCVRALTMFAPLLGVLLFAEPIAAQAPAPSTPATLANETPTQFMPVTDSFDYARRDVKIPMRDGVKLHTRGMAPSTAKNAPILLPRTPYDATDLTTPEHTSHLGPAAHGYDISREVILKPCYIRVFE